VLGLGKPSIGGRRPARTYLSIHTYMYIHGKARVGMLGITGPHLAGFDLLDRRYEAVISLTI
jgi:hypothetical protein